MALKKKSFGEEFCLEGPLEKEKNVDFPRWFIHHGVGLNGGDGIYDMVNLTDLKLNI